MLLNKPIHIRNTVIENRVVLPPMATGKANTDGTVTDELIEYYKDRAIGGYTGLIITEHTYIDPLGIAGLTQVSVCKDSDIESIKKIADAVHSVGTSRIFAQINHAGISKERKAPGKAKGPSPINKPWKTGIENPQELTKDEIIEIVSKFALAALRVKKAGYDGVELHAAHGNLLNQFYSPITNIRVDEYGGSLMNRTRIIHETLIETRKLVGEDFPISIRLGGIDYCDNGNRIEDCIETCKLLEKWGADMISLTGGMNGYIRPEHSEPGYFKEMSIAAKKVVKIPIMMTGGIKTGEEAEALLEEGAADLVGVGRAMMKDAGWSKKVLDK